MPTKVRVPTCDEGWTGKLERLGARGTRMKGHKLCQHPAPGGGRARVAVKGEAWVRVDPRERRR